MNKQDEIYIKLDWYTPLRKQYLKSKCCGVPYILDHTDEGFDSDSECETGHTAYICSKCDTEQFFTY